MTKIKVCGIREPAHALIAAEEGADYVGVIFTPMSSRMVTLEEACAVSEALGNAYPNGNGPKVVGVFVNAPVWEMNKLADICRLDLLQLSGDEPWSICQSLDRPAVKALRVSSDADPKAVSTELSERLPELSAREGLCLIESHVAGRYGGTGQQLNWALGADIASKHAFLLSGGLDPDNITAALEQVQPWGVDVSSGVETDGRKDEAKIRAFIRAVKAFDNARASAQPMREG